jgi:multidrug efflux system membrane fusion protein
MEDEIDVLKKRPTDNPLSAKAKRRILWGRWPGLILAGIAALYAFRHFADATSPETHPKSVNPAAAAIAVVAEIATQEDFPIFLSGLGSVTALHTVTVRSRVDGELVRIHFKEGQMVREGELLAEIDPRPFQVQLQQAEAQLAKDEALLKNAQIDLARYKTLLAQDSIAEQQTVTQGSLVKQIAGTVETDRAQVANAKLQLVYARITAPITGRIGLRLVDPGNIVHASDSGGLLVITQIQPITVVFTLPEDDLPAVMKRWRMGDTIPVDAYDRAGKTKLAGGFLLAVDNQIDAATGTVKLKAQFPNENHALFPNQFVNIKMNLDTLKSVTIAPSSAIQRGTPGTFVYVVGENQTVSVRPVKTGPVEGEKTAILEGLAPGEWVVVDGADKLREGAKVELIHRNYPPLAGGKEESPGNKREQGKKPAIGNGE